MFTSPLWRTIHSLAALLSGGLFAAIALSGSLLVLVEPGTGETAAASEHRVSLDRVATTLQAEYPKVYSPWTLDLPTQATGIITARNRQRDTLTKDASASIQISIDPGSGQILSRTTGNHTTMAWLQQLHAELRLGKWGHMLVGITGIMAILLIISGLGRAWIGSQQPRTSAPPNCYPLSRICHDTHWLVGALSFPVLAFILITGVSLSFRQPLEWLTGAGPMAHAGGRTGTRSTAEPNSQPVGIEAASLVARGLFPHAMLRRVTMPAGETGSYRIELCQRIEEDCRHAQTFVWVDRYSGQILDVQNPRHFSEGQRLVGNLSYYHTGAALGFLGLLIWVLVGLVPTMLFATGSYHWLRRKKWIADCPIDLEALRRKSRALYRAASSFIRHAWHYLRANGLTVARWFVRYQKNSQRRRVD